MAHGRIGLSIIPERLSGESQDYQAPGYFINTLADPKGLSLARVEYREEDLATGTTDHYSLPLGPTPGLCRGRVCTLLIDW